MTVLCSPVLSDIRKRIALFERYEVSPACPSEKSSIKMTIGMEHWWMIVAVENRCSLRKTCPIAKFSSTNFTHCDPSSKRGLRDESPATNRARHGASTLNSKVIAPCLH
jgi:hypothetical protein